MIYIGNLHKGHEDTLRKGLVIRCDRGHSVLCNPFNVANESQRDWSCEQFQKYFDKKVQEKTDTAFMNELRRIYQLALKQDIVLACWCYPKRCHTMTIKAYLDKFLNADKNYKAKQPSTRREYRRELTATEKKTLDYCITKYGWTVEWRQAMAASLVREWSAVLYSKVTSQRQFVNDLEDYCLERTFKTDKGETISGAEMFASLKYKALCLIEQVKYIVLDYKISHVSDGTIALCQYNVYPSDGTIKRQKIYIAWRKTEPQTEEERKQQAQQQYRQAKQRQQQAEQRQQQAEQRHQLKQEYEDKLPTTLQERNIHLYREGREDHSWLQEIQDARAAHEEQTYMQDQLTKLKEKYKK